MFSRKISFSLFQRLKISRNSKEIKSSYTITWKSCSLFGHAEVNNNKHQLGQKPLQSKQEPYVTSEWVCSLIFQSQWISSKVMSYQFYEHSCQASEILLHQLIVQNTNTTPRNSNTLFITNTYYKSIFLFSNNSDKKGFYTVTHKTILFF